MLTPTTPVISPPISTVTPFATPLVIPSPLPTAIASQVITPTIVTSTIPIDCKRESDDYWDCFEPSFMDGKGSVCRGDCMRECSMWLGHSRGLLVECQEAMHEIMRIYPANVSTTSMWKQDKYSGSLPDLVDSEGGLTPLASSPRYLHSPQSFPWGSRSTFLEVRIPYIYLAIETPGYYLLPDGQHRLRYYISHYITPVRLNDETRWKIQATLGDDGKPLSGISAGRIEEDKNFYDINGASQEICNLMGTSNLKTLILHIEIPRSTLQTLFADEEELRYWWAIYRNKVRVFKGRSAWFPPAQAGGYGDITEESLYFTGDRERVFRWRLRLSLRHLLLFYLIKTKPEGSELTRLEKRTVTYSLLPKKVRSFFRDFTFSHG